MSLVKAFIQPLDANDALSGPRVPVMFNPTDYTVERGNQYQSTKILGLSTPLTQFVSGEGESLSMDLFFDTYEEGKDVREHTSPITNLLAIDSELHAPPRCIFTWGRFSFKATLEKVTSKFTMFLGDGTPVRATLSVSFKEYKTMSEQLGNTPRHSSDKTKVRMMTEGDSLWIMAAREYGDPGQWKTIARANDLENPRLLPPGLLLVLPPVE